MSFFSIAVFAKTFTIAMPKDSLSSIYEKVLNALEFEEIEFRLVRIDFSKDINFLKKEIDKADVLFVPSVYLLKTIKQIKPQKTKVVFIGLKNLHKIPQELKENFFGVYRADGIKD